MPQDSRLYFAHVVATSSGDAFLAGHAADQGSEPTFTRFAKVGDGGWLHLGDLGAVVCATAAMVTPGSTRASVLALGRDGPLRLYRPGQPPTDIAVPLKDKTSYLEGICTASDRIYVCGGQRQVGRRSHDRWQWIDQGLFVKFDGTNDCTLFSIAAIADDVLLTVGTKGFAATRSNDGPWELLDTGTNVDLKCIVATGDGGAWVGGDGGTLLRLSSDLRSWSDESNPSVSTRSFDSLALLNGTLYIAAFDKLLEVATPGGLSVTPLPGKPGAEYHALSSAGDFLWVTGDEHVHRLGPDGWKYFLCPDNT